MSLKQSAQKLFVCQRLMSTVGNDSIRYVSPSQALNDLGHRVSPFERVLLVWSGRFKSLAEVPTTVTRDTMERSRNYFRIRVNLTVFGVAILGAFMMVISGKNAAHRGENLQQQNLDWHRRYNAANSK